MFKYKPILKEYTKSKIIPFPSADKGIEKVFTKNNGFTVKGKTVTYKTEGVGDDIWKHLFDSNSQDIIESYMVNSEFLEMETGLNDKDAIKNWADNLNRENIQKLQQYMPGYNGEDDYDELIGRYGEDVVDKFGIALNRSIENAMESDFYIELIKRFIKALKDVDIFSKVEFKSYDDIVLTINDSFVKKCVELVKEAEKSEDDTVFTSVAGYEFDLRYYTDYDITDWDTDLLKIDMERYYATASKEDFNEAFGDFGIDSGFEV